MMSAARVIRLCRISLKWDVEGETSRGEREGYDLAHEMDGTAVAEAQGLGHEVGCKHH